MNFAVEFQIDRFKNKITGQYVLEANVSEGLPYEHKLVSLTVSGSVYEEKTKIADSFENSVLGGIDPVIDYIEDENGNDWSKNLTESEIEYLGLKIEESILCKHKTSKEAN